MSTPNEREHETEVDLCKAILGHHSVDEVPALCQRLVAYRVEIEARVRQEERERGRQALAAIARAYHREARPDCTTCRYYVVDEPGPSCKGNGDATTCHYWQSAQPEAKDGEREALADHFASIRDAWETVVHYSRVNVDEEIAAFNRSLNRIEHTLAQPQPAQPSGEAK